MNKLYFLVFCIAFVSSKKEIIDFNAEMIWKKDKIKSIEYFNYKGERVLTTYNYELLLPDSVVVVKEKRLQDDQNLVDEKIVYTRDASRKLVSAKRSYAKKDSMVSMERKYTYNSSSQLLYYTDSLPNRTYGHGYQYHPDGKLKIQYAYSRINNKLKTFDTYEYKWLNGNISTMIDRNSRYEEIDYQYEKKSNILYELQSKHLGEIGNEVEYLTPTQIGASQEAFRGTRSRFTYEYDGNGRLTTIIYNEIVDGNLLPLNKKLITYYY
jgi:hypothetical protein